VFENRVLRRVFGSRRDEVTGAWRKLHNEELSDLYCSPNVISCDKIKKSEMGWDMWHAWRRSEMNPAFR